MLGEHGHRERALDGPATHGDEGGESIELVHEKESAPVAHVAFGPQARRKIVDHLPAQSLDALAPLGVGRLGLQSPCGWPKKARP